MDDDGDHDVNEDDDGGGCFAVLCGARHQVKITRHLYATITLPLRTLDMSDLGGAATLRNPGSVRPGVTAWNEN